MASSPALGDAKDHCLALVKSVSVYGGTADFEVTTMEKLWLGSLRISICGAKTVAVAQFATLHSYLQGTLVDGALATSLGGSLVVSVVSSLVVQRLRKSSAMSLRAASKAGKRVDATERRSA